MELLVQLNECAHPYVLRHQVNCVGVMNPAVRKKTEGEAFQSLDFQTSSQTSTEIYRQGAP